MANRSRKRDRGFTLIELMIVISMILILVSMSIPAYNQSILRAKESVLRQDLFQLRSLIRTTRTLGAMAAGRWNRKTP